VGTRDLTFDEAVAALAAWTGEKVSVSLRDARYGADGYLADFSGRLTSIDEPEWDNEAGITYFKFDTSEGFAFSRAMFETAGWSEFGELEIQLDGVALSAKPVE